MNANQLRQAMEIVTSGEDLTEVDDSSLHGCALPEFKPVTTTLRIVAKMLRYQCMQLNGEIDSQELDSLTRIFRHKVTII